MAQYSQEHDFMKRAKTRLRPDFLTATPAAAEPAITTRLGSFRRQEKPQQQLARYLRFLPVLLLSLPFYGAVISIITNFRPHQIADTFFSNSYFFLQLPLLIANLLMFSFILLNTRRGLLLSFFLSVLLFLKLQHVLIEWSWLIPLALIFVSLELVATQLSKRAT